MAVYFYHGTLTSKKKSEGLVAAESEEDAIEQLEKIAVIKPKLFKLGSFNGYEYKIIKQKKIRKIKKKDIAYLFTQMSFLIKSGITTYDAIGVLSVSVNANVAMVCRQIRELIIQGTTFSDALDQINIIPKDIIEKIRAGETSNTMGEALENVAQKLKEEMELASSVRAGLTYPIFSLVVIFGIAMFMLTVLIPKIADMVADFGAELPGITKFLIACSDAVVHYWWLCLIILGILIFTHIKLIKTNYKYKYFIDKYIYNVPILGKIMKKLHMVYLSSVLSQLMNSGKNTSDSVILAKNTITNLYLKEAVEKVEVNLIRQGMNLFEAMQELEVFPGEFIQMIAIGVRTGNMPEVLDNIYNQYRYEAKDEIKAATDMLQPISLILIGAIAAVFVIGMYAAIYCIFETV